MTSIWSLQCIWGWYMQFSYSWNFVLFHSCNTMNLIYFLRVELENVYQMCILSGANDVNGGYISLLCRASVCPRWFNVIVGGQVELKVPFSTVVSCHSCHDYCILLFHNFENAWTCINLFNYIYDVLFLIARLNDWQAWLRPGQLQPF